MGARGTAEAGLQEGVAMSVTTQPDPRDEEATPEDGEAGVEVTSSDEGGTTFEPEEDPDALA